MEENKGFQPNKSDIDRKAIGSLILGAISMISVSLSISYNLYSYQMSPQILAQVGRTVANLATQNTFLGLLLSVLLPLSLLTSLVGLILGKMALKSDKKNLAIGGIALCVISLLGFAYSFYWTWIVPFGM